MTSSKELLVTLNITVSMDYAYGDFTDIPKITSEKFT